jgi:hypothetical protein
MPDGAVQNLSDADAIEVQSRAMLGEIRGLRRKNSEAKRTAFLIKAAFKGLRN